MDIDVNFVDLLNPWTNLEDLDRPIYRYISFQEFASITELHIAQCKRLDSFNDPWDSAIYAGAFNQSFTKSGKQFEESITHTKITSQILSSNISDNDELDEPSKVENLDEYSRRHKTAYYSTERSATGNSEMLSPRDEELAKIRRENYAWCWTFNDPENMSMWLAYANSPTSVCLKSTPRIILESLNPFFPNYCGLVNYQQFENTESRYIPFTKIEAFKFENEFRFIYTNVESVTLNKPAMQLNFSLPIKSIIYLHPHARKGIVDLIRRAYGDTQHQLKLELLKYNQGELP